MFAGPENCVVTGGAATFRFMPLMLLAQPAQRPPLACLGTEPRAAQGPPESLRQSQCPNSAAPGPVAVSA